MWTLYEIQVLESANTVLLEGSYHYDWLICFCIVWAAFILQQD